MAYKSSVAYIPCKSSAQKTSTLIGRSSGVVIEYAQREDPKMCNILKAADCRAKR